MQLRELTGRRPDPAEAREVRTVDELITFVEAEIAKGPDEGDPGSIPDPRELFGADAATKPADAESSTAAESSTDAPESPEGDD